MKLTEPEKKDPALSEDEREGDPADEVPETLAEKIFGIFHRLLPILFACSVAGVGVVLFFAGPREKAANGETAAESSIEPPEPETSVRRLDYDAADLSRESRLRDALVEERGGRVALADLRSLKAVGNLTTEGMDGSFVLMKNESRQALMRVFFPDRTLSVGRDNETLWKTVRAEGGSTETAGIFPEDKILLKALGEIHGPLLKRFFRGTAVIRSVENAEGEDGRVIRVTLFCRKNPGVEEVDLDPTSLALVRWQFTAENRDTIVAYYRDNRRVNEILHPFSTEIWRNGELLAEWEVETLTPNFGAVDLLFRNPLAQRTSSSAKSISSYRP